MEVFKYQPGLAEGGQPAPLFQPASHFFASQPTPPAPRVLTKAAEAERLRIARVEGPTDKEDGLLAHDAGGPPPQPVGAVLVHGEPPAAPQRVVRLAWERGQAGVPLQGRGGPSTAVASGRRDQGGAAAGDGYRLGGGRGVRVGFGSRAMGSCLGRTHRNAGETAHR